jgi:hypothetical protein
VAKTVENGCLLYLFIRCLCGNNYSPIRGAIDIQGSHCPGKPGKVREKNGGQGKVGEFFSC